MLLAEDDMINSVMENRDLTLEAIINLKQQEEQNQPILNLPNKQQKQQSAINNQNQQQYQY